MFLRVWRPRSIRGPTISGSGRFKGDTSRIWWWHTSGFIMRRKEWRYEKLLLENVSDALNEEQKRQFTKPLLKEM